MIAIIDYGAGNLQSVANALTHLDVTHRVCRVPGDLTDADRIILPGVGHFGSAARHLAATGLLDAIRERAQAGMPLLGICLGMQLLFATSEEDGSVNGMSLYEGRVTRLKVSRVPHMGWNQVLSRRACPLVAQPQGHYYFAHSFAVADVPPDLVVATASIDGSELPVIVGRGQCWGVQFHPEKSAELGLDMLKRFATC